MNLSEVERFELREIIATEILRITNVMNQHSKKSDVDYNIHRLRWERIEFLLAIREKLK